MKRITVVCLSLAVAAFAVVPGWAKGIFIQPGARESSMGSAMTAVADDATAVYYNPAGLAQKNGSGIEAASFFLRANATSNKSLANTGAADSINGDFPLPNLNALGLSPAPEPAEYNSKKFETNATVPFIGAYKNVNDITYALSVYGIGGGGGKWRDSVSALGGLANIDASIDGTYAFIVYNFSAATKLNSKLMLGLGLDFVNMIDNTNVQKYFRTIAGTSIYSLALNEGATGYGIQVNGGLLYKFDEKWKGGLVVRSGTTIKLNGEAKFMGNQTDYTNDYIYPLTAAVGVSYEPKNDLTLAFSVDQNNYSKMHEKIHYNTNIGLADTDEPLQGRDWNDTTQIHIGAEYRCCEKLALRAGIQTDPAPFSTKELTLTELNQYNYIYYSVGAGYKICNVDVDLCYAYCPSDTPSVGDRSYQYNLDVFRLGLRYSF